ncbi:MAG: N-formylglutamate amidohydrolase [Minwuia sp.]|nr:N-formylglutamate amidohydrolase [Minwuia sp.]
MLTADDPAPVLFERSPGAGGVLLTCEHGGRAIPRALGDLGVAAADMQRHIAWDIGALALSQALLQRVSARLVSQHFSRLVIDCNRGPASPDLIPAISDETHVPGNRNLSQSEIQARTSAIHTPFHDCIAAEIVRDRPRLLVSIHSFTPVMGQDRRRMHAGFLANRMPEVAARFMTAIGAAAPELVLSLNEPYTVDDISDYTVPVHGEGNRLPHVLVEVRNDQLQDPAGISRWADLLAIAIRDVEAGEP